MHIWGEIGAKLFAGNVLLKKLKKKKITNYMIMSIDAEKAFDNIQHQFARKNSQWSRNILEYS